MDATATSAATVPTGAPAGMTPNGTTSTLIDALRAAVGADQIRTDPDVTAAYSRDMMPLAPSGVPLAVVFPTDTAQVVAVVKACAAAGVPIVPRGAGSGLTGAANAVDGAVTVVLTRMNRILEIDEGNRLAVVQPGIVNLDFRTEVESRNLFYAPDPSSYDWCTIGGNLNTNAGGLCCVKYGVTTDAVLGLEVVLASGEVLRTGRRTVKGVAGYDLTKLFIGSEGTLGIITEATLALRPKPAVPCTMVAAFADTESAGAAVSAAIRAGLVPSLLEIMDATCIKAVEAYTGSSILGEGDTPAAILIGQSDAGPQVGRREMDDLERVCLTAGSTFAYVTDDLAEGRPAVAGPPVGAHLVGGARHLADRRRLRPAHRDGQADPRLRGDRRRRRLDHRRGRARRGRQHAPDDRL
jgi:glycolate oxidase